MSKRKFTWEYYLKCAKAKYLDSEKFIQLSVRTLMLDKGFSLETAVLFNCCFASSLEDIITFNGEGEFLELDLKSASEMTKDEIIEFFSNEISSNSLQLLLNDI